MLSPLVVYAHNVGSESGYRRVLGKKSAIFDSAVRCASVRAGCYVMPLHCYSIIGLMRTSASEIDNLSTLLLLHNKSLWSLECACVTTPSAPTSGGQDATAAAATPGKISLPWTNIHRVKSQQPQLSQI